MNIVKILCQVHMQQTMITPAPFYFEPKINNLESLVLPTSEEDKKKFIQHIYSTKYIELKNPKGSVDCASEFWGLMLFDVLEQCRESNKKGTQIIAKIPNGCCGQNSCYINVFYQMLIDNMK
jgi:hypothetical protein